MSLSIYYLVLFASLFLGKILGQGTTLGYRPPPWVIIPPGGANTTNNSNTTNGTIFARGMILARAKVGRRRKESTGERKVRAKV